MTIRNFSRVTAISLAIAALIACGSAHSHGLPKKVHGGLVETQMDLGFEVFMQGRRLVVYVTDHDSPFDTKLFTAQAAFARVVIPLESVPGGRLMSQPLAKIPNLHGLKVTLSADVLTEPISLQFVP